MELITQNWKKILVIGLMLAGLAVTMYLALNPQIFKSKAAMESVNKLSGENIERLDQTQVEKLGVDGIDQDTPVFKVRGNNFTIHYNP